MTTDEQLAAIRERHAKATPGMFAYESEKCGWTIQVPSGWLLQDSRDRRCTIDDARFLGEAQKDIAFLLDRIATLAAERNGLLVKIGLMEVTAGQCQCEDLTAELAAAKKYIRGGDDQLCALSAWAKKRFDADTNLLIGEASGEYTLVGVVTKIVDEQLAAANARADGERAKVVAWLRERADGIAMVNRECGGDYRLAAQANVIDEAADAIARGEHEKGGGDAQSE